MATRRVPREMITLDDVLENKDQAMSVESNRLESFVEWPISRGSCVKENMAKAGFYSTGADDAVRCFCCLKELEGWSESDDPWKEHLSHNSRCLFANLGKQQSDLTVAEFMQLLEERQVNRLATRVTHHEAEEMQKLELLGIPQEMMKQV